MLGVGDGGNGGREFCDKNRESVMLNARGQDKRLSKSFEEISKWSFVSFPSLSPPLNLN